MATRKKADAVDEVVEAGEENIPQSSEKPKKRKARKSSENLIPNSQRSPSELRKQCSKGGKKSGETRRAKKAVKEALKKAPTDVMDWLYSLQPDSKTREVLSEKLGIPIDEIDSVEKVSAVSMYSQVRKGNVKAFEALERKKSSSDDSNLRKQELKLKEKELQIKDERHKAEMAELEAKTKDSEDNYHGIPVLAIGPKYAELVFDIENRRHSEYVLPGGRGSLKSSFISIAIVDQLQKHSNLNALVLRNVANTLGDSVYAQIEWAIDKLDLNDKWVAKKSPLKFVNKKTGQQILFRGADEPAKLKSLKTKIGYIGLLWLEELDQFAGPEAVRNIEQSAIRGGDDAIIFKSFNPPRSAINWANKYILVPKESRMVFKSDYRSVPKEWLGKTWIEEAEFLKKVNPQAYENEYLGIANGDGGNVFTNVETREITNDEIAEFDRILQGVDWGWDPDPFHYSRMHYDSARMILYIFGEIRCNRKGNEETAQMIKDTFNRTWKTSDGREVEESVFDSNIICDSAENKSVADYKAFGLPARAAVKGPGSVPYSMKWLQRLKKIVIDPTRCPATAKEFAEYEYERDKDGNIISGYPDMNNHAIDSVRYATQPVWKRKGQ